MRVALDAMSGDEPDPELGALAEAVSGAARDGFDDHG
jgi:hypothetical protein